MMWNTRKILLTQITAGSVKVYLEKKKELKIPNFRFAQEFGDEEKERSSTLTSLGFQAHVSASHGSPERINNFLNYLSD